MAKYVRSRHYRCHQGGMPFAYAFERESPITFVKWNATGALIIGVGTQSTTGLTVP